MKYASLLLALLIWPLACVFAQTPFEGVIRTTVKLVQAPPELEGMENALGQHMTTYVKGNKSRVEQTSISGNNIIITDRESRQVVMLLDMMGQKIAMTLAMTEDYPGQGVNLTEFEYAGQPIRMTGEIRNISGYSCEKGILNLDDNISTECWFARAFPFSGLFDKRLPGMPMQYTILQDKVHMEFTLSEIREEVLDPSIFTIPDEYTVKTSEEMMQFMPLMQGGPDGE